MFFNEKKRKRLRNDKVTVQRALPWPPKKLSHLTITWKYVNSTTHLTVFNLQLCEFCKEAWLSIKFTHPDWRTICKKNFRWPRKGTSHCKFPEDLVGVPMCRLWRHVKTKNCQGKFEIAGLTVEAMRWKRTIYARNVQKQSFLLLSTQYKTILELFAYETSSLPSWCKQ